MYLETYFKSVSSMSKQAGEAEGNNIKKQQPVKEVPSVPVRSREEFYMTLEDLSERYSNLNICEKRTTTAEYCELVFYSKETDDWNKVIASFLGPPIKVAGVKPAKHDMHLTEEFGGICDNQTLFKKESDGTVVIAMFWPWQDAAHTTLKTALLRK